MSETAMEERLQLPSDLGETNVQALLGANLGRAVTAEFWHGDQLVSKQGTLYAVEDGYLVLYNAQTAQSIVCMLCSLAFITFLADTAEQPQAESQPQPVAATPSQAAFQYARRRSGKI